MLGAQAQAVALPSERAWNWAFWTAILAFEVIGVLLSAHA